MEICVVVCSPLWPLCPCVLATLEICQNTQNGNEERAHGVCVLPCTVHMFPSIYRLPTQNVYFHAIHANNPNLQELHFFGRLLRFTFFSWRQH